MEIVKVTDRKTENMFLDTARFIYKEDTTWVCPLDSSLKAVFNPSDNTYFKHGEAERWILLDEKSRLTGRIAAFIDYKLAETYEQPTGGIGFFECIKNKEAAFLLFDTARDWLISRGMEAMDGPINFGETDKFWGLLVNGFTQPAFEIAYNPPYYQELFESYGFMTYYNMEGFHLDLTKPLPERFTKIAEWVASKPGYKFSHFTWKEEDKYVYDFTSVFNETWSAYKANFEPLEPDYVRAFLKKGKVILDEEFMWIAYYEEKPIAVYLMLPDANQILRHMNGKMNLINMIRFLWYKKQKTITRARGMLMGVIPKFQGLGIESGFILSLAKALKRKPQYTEIEFTWVGDFNPRMRKIFISVGSVPVKNYKTYRYLFDRTREFQRYPIREIRRD
jgi:hypothetical protein